MFIGIGIGVNRMKSGAGGAPAPYVWPVSLDYVNDVEVGGTQPYGNNANDGRLFRDGTNSVACFAPANSNGTGLLMPVGAAGLRRTTGGCWHYPSMTNRCLHNRDWSITHQLAVTGGSGSFTNGETVNASGGGSGVYRAANSTAAIFAISNGVGTLTGTLTGASSGATKTISSATVIWQVQNVTATKDQVGADGTANAATRLTSNDIASGITQFITLGAGQVVFSANVRRITGTGAVFITVDNFSNQLNIGSQINSSTYTQVFRTQAGVLNPVIGFNFANNGDEIAVDFAELITPANSMNIPKRDRVATATATVLNTQSRPTADATDIAPQTMLTAMRGPHAGFWQGRSERGAGGGFVTGITSVFGSINASNNVSFAAGGGVATTPNGAFVPGLANRNKIAWCYDAGGVIRVSCNGQSGAGTGATAEPTLDHWDEGTNGSGTRSIYGPTELLKLAPNKMFSLAELDALTA